MKINYKKVIKLYKSGLSLREVGKRLRCGKSTIRRILVKKRMARHHRLCIKDPYNKSLVGTERLRGDRWWVKIDQGEWILRARYIMEKKLGHPIPKGYEVHHVDENPSNDKLSNLELKLHWKHSSDHNTKNLLPKGAK